MISFRHKDNDKSKTNDMKYILGIDVGTNSIGWVLLLGDKIIDKGVVIFPIGTNLQKGIQEVSKNQERGGYRRAKRNLFRYKLRRKDLKRLLSDLEMLPNFKKTFEIKGNYQSVDLYKLRADALTQKIPLEEIGRIFLLINKHRGFKSNSKTLADKSDDQKDEDGKVNSGIQQLETFITNSKSKTIGEYFYKMYEKANELFNEGKWHNINEPFDERAIDENGDFVLYNNRGIRRENGRYVSRKMYETEFDLIWDKQKEFYPQFTGSSKEYEEIKKLPIEQKRTALKEFKHTDYWKIRNSTIFYQRELKSQKKYISKCQFETNKRTAPVSSLLFQEFRIWKQLADLRYTDESNDIYISPLKDEWKQKIVDYLETHFSLSLRQTKTNKDGTRKDDIMDILGIENKKAIQFNFDNDDDDKVFQGNKTLYAIYSACGTEKYEQLKAENKLEKLWHILYMAKDDEWLKDTLLLNWDFDDATANNLVEMGLEEGFASYSSKVLKKVLPFMQQGKDEFDALVLAGYMQSPDEAKEEVKLKSKISSLKNNELRNPVVEKSVNQIIRTVNAILANEEYKINQEELEIHIESTREFKKPKKEREAIRRGNAETEKKRIAYAEFLNQKRKDGKLSFKREIYPNDPIIRKFELWLEMGYDKDDETFKKFEKLATKTNKEKYQLWLECNRLCPYSGRIINLSTLFSSETEIEHIIPYSKSLDDSFANKTITFTYINKEKGNDIPVDYFKKKKSKEEFDAFKDRIKGFDKDKREKRFLLEKVEYDFTNSQYPNTSYIAKYARKKMLEVCRDVLFTNGAATADLRKNDWRLESLLDKIRYEEETEIDIDFYLRAFSLYKKGFLEWRKRKFNSTDLPKIEWKKITQEDTTEYEKETKEPLFEWWQEIQKFDAFRGANGRKKRDDHRHHLLDAIITACTNRSIIQKLSTLNAQRETLGIPMYDEKGRVTRDEIDCPLRYEDIKSALKDVLIYHKAEQRLITARTNKIKKKKATKEGSNFIKQKTYAVRGSLHKDTFYGKLKDPKHQGFDRNIVFVSRVTLNGENFKNEESLSKIVDKNIREILKGRLAEYKGDGEKAFSAEEMLKSPIYLYSVDEYKDKSLDNVKSKNGNPLPSIKKVRVANKNVRNLVQLPAKENKTDIVFENRYAESDSNYVMALYEQKQFDKKGNEKKPKRDFEIVSFYEAANRKRKGEKLFPDEKNEIGLMNSCPYLIAGDMVIMYEGGEDEIKWDNNADLKKRLYKVTELGLDYRTEEQQYGVIKFTLHNKQKSSKEGYSKEGNFIKVLHTGLKAVKVKINQLGKIERI